MSYQVVKRHRGTIILVQFTRSVVSDSLWPHGLPARFPFLHYLPEFAQIHIYWVSVAIQPSHLLSSPSPHAFNLSQHQGLCKGVSSSHQMAKYWSFSFSFSFSISPSNEYSGLISFRMGWLNLLAVQGTLKSLLQHHSPKASILPCSAFFMVQLASVCEHDYWKNHSFD